MPICDAYNLFRQDKQNFTSECIPLKVPYLCLENALIRPVAHLITLTTLRYMIKRIVKMTFRPEAVSTFVTDVFERSKSRIRAFPGCRHMELLQSAAEPNVLFTLSIWERESDLETYRQSELFLSTWAQTKALFADKPEAWTVTVVDGPAALVEGLD